MVKLRVLAIHIVNVREEVTDLALFEALTDQFSLGFFSLIANSAKTFFSPYTFLGRRVILLLDNY